MRLLLAISFLLPLCAVDGWCGITFEEPVLNLRSTPSERQVEGHFRFRNSGPVAVTIKRVKTSCGCTTARLAKERYEPGEEGVLEAVFKYGFEKGRLRKLLTVLTDDPDSPEIGLEMRVVVEEMVELSPQLVYWRIGEPVTTKSVRVKVQPDLRIRAVRSDDAAFEVRLRQGGSPSEYGIDVTPKRTDSRAAATIELVMEHAEGKTRRYKAHARVK